jgi:hypothetical protein
MGKRQGYQSGSQYRSSGKYPIYLGEWFSTFLKVVFPSSSRSMSSRLHNLLKQSQIRENPILQQHNCKNLIIFKA